MKKQKEIVLYVEEMELTKQKKIGRRDRANKEISLIRNFLKKAIPPDQQFQTGVRPQRAGR